jgi:hypothetical protein
MQRAFEYWEAARRSLQYTHKVTRGRTNFGYEIHRIQASPVTMMDVVQTQERPPMHRSYGGSVAASWIRRGKQTTTGTLPLCVGIFEVCLVIEKIDCASIPIMHLGLLASSEAKKVAL